MNKKTLGLIAISFVVFIIVGKKYGLLGLSSEDSFPKLPAEPGFEVSTHFDGEWLGRRINVTNNNLCERTTITGKIVDGKASLRLDYNGTPLQGWVDQQGNLVLYASNRHWDYRFSATGANTRFTGEWYLTNGPCKGSWFIEKISESAG
ncbi:hypothetical protein [Vibrio mexicanus]|uniref:hypothetical protein n=1 Tax=Vibrio mexicanus TaxID=1004326 RepID=UPI00063C18BD|nr:hypothetical protein [Vibrio mexicanus]